MNEFMPTLHEPRDLQTAYDRAVYWLERALRVDDATAIRDEALRIQFAAKQAKNRDMTANAIELQIRAERRLGEMIIAAHEAGQISKGGRPRKLSAPPSGPGQPVGGPETGAAEEPVSGPGQPLRFTLEEAGIDKKLSAKAQQLAKKPAELFEIMIAEQRAKIEAGKAIVVNPMKEVNTLDKQLRRRIKEAQLAKKQKALPDRVYGVILEDPEWQFEVRSERGQDRAAANHYPTSDLTTIKQRPVAKIAAADCALFLWATVPMLPQALEVLRFRGFEYKSHFVWDKIDEGTGYWNRNRHEILIVATRGNVPAPAPGTQWPSVIQSRPGAHSAKPDWAYELIEAYFPNLPRIELNARRSRPGWDAWGLEAPEEEYPEGESGTAREAPGGKPTAQADIGGLEQGAQPAPRTPSTAVEGPDLPSVDDVSRMEDDPAYCAYHQLVAADTLKGQHTRETARPILEAGYACEPIVPVKQLAEDLGHKLMTVLSWAKRCGLSDVGRRNAALAEHRARFKPQHESSGAPVSP